MIQLFLFFLIAVLDILTTLYGISLGASEVNPLVKITMRNHGVWGFVIFKLTISLTILLLFHYLIWKSGTGIALKVLMVVNVIGGAVVLWNIGQLVYAHYLIRL